MAVSLRKDGQAPEWNPPGPFRKDGQPNMKYAVNKKYVAEYNLKLQDKISVRKSTANYSLESDLDEESTGNLPKWNPPGPLRKDGQPNMKYAVNKKYVAEYNIKTQDKIPGYITNDSTDSHSSDLAITGNIKFGLVNTQSLIDNKRMDYLKDRIEKSKLDIVAVTETWFSDKTNLKKCCPEGFKAVHEPREEGKGGGVAIFYRDNLKITRHSLTDYKSFEYIDVVIDSNKKIRLIVIYRPPNNRKTRQTKVNKADFLDDFEQLLKKAEGNRELLITGDFNLHVENPDTDDEEFLDLIELHGLVQHVKKPTHEKGGILDLIITRQSDSLVKNVKVGGYFKPKPDKKLDHKFVHCDIHIQAKTDDIFEREE